MIRQPRKPAKPARDGISRRDFLDGLPLALGLAFRGPSLASARQPGRVFYPPRLTGLRGSSEGSFETAHALRDGDLKAAASASKSKDPRYDLVVVGAGISGLASAMLFRKKEGSAARVLILDNHDDFGGHARRNEFEVRGRTLLGNGGSQSLDSPSEWSEVARALLTDLGVKTERFHDAFDTSFYSRRGLGLSVFFDRETFGEDRLVKDYATENRSWTNFFSQTPLPPETRAALVRVHEDRSDWLASLSRDEKRERLSRMSYERFLREFGGLDAAGTAFFRAHTHDLFGLGTDAVSALDCLEAGDDFGRAYPGLTALGLDEGGGADEPYIFHFPDGNASIARLLLAKMRPDVARLGRDPMADVVTAAFDYASLDKAGASPRVRLRSTVTRIRNVAASGGGGVEVEYVEGGERHVVRAQACIYAGWSSMAHHVIPDLPARQKDALAESVKVPLVYVNVALRNWTSWMSARTHRIFCPGAYFSTAMLDFPVSLGAHAFPKDPKDPIVAFLVRTPCAPGLPAKTQHRAGRAELLETSFAAFEREIRSQLSRMLGPHGLDPKRDILGITVNRWAHGYTYEGNSLFDPDLPPERAPHVLGRQPLGRIALAGCDAGGRAFADTAIDEAHRAVEEIL